MTIITNTLTLNDLKKMAANMFGDMVKAVVDIDRVLVAVDAELHADLEAHLLEDGSKLHDLWGINLYPETCIEDFIEFDSMITFVHHRATGAEGSKAKRFETPSLKLSVKGLADDI